MRVPSDTIVYIFGALGPYARFKMSKRKIQSAFYAISRKKEFKKLFKDIIFTDKHYSPPFWSETVDIALIRPWLDTINLELYEVSPYLAAQDPAGLFSKKEIELIKKAAVEFEKMVEVKRIKVCKCPTPDCSKIGLTD